MRPMAWPHVDGETAGRAALPAIHLEAEERLRRSPYLALQVVSCLARVGVIDRYGRLPSYHLKPIAQEIVAGVAGVRHVVNRIEVAAPSGRARPGRETSANSTRGFQSSHDILRGERQPPRTHDTRKEFATMLVLSRRRNETLIINGDIRIMVVDIRGNQVRLGIEAPGGVAILRNELSQMAATPPTPARPDVNPGGIRSRPGSRRQD